MKKFLLLLLCAGCGAVLAAEDDITFHGTLMSPPACSISGGQTIEVQFRDLIIDSIAGNYGRQEVDYELSCESDVRDPEWNMTLSWTGTATSYNDSAIEIQHDGQRFKLNEPLSINATDFSQKPKLEAVPVKAADAVLTDTTFSAYATLRVDYQ